MAETKAYHTKQRELITQCLSEHAEHHLTAAQVASYIRASGSRIGAATVYRNLELLTDEGVIKKFETGAGGAACYQMTEDAGEDCAHHYHLKCTTCGQLIHLDCEALDDLRSHVMAHHDFEIDITRLVLYGQCMDCRRRAHLRHTHNESD